MESVWMVGRLEADPVIEEGRCTLRVASGDATERHVDVSGEAVRVCARLRRGALVGVEGRSDGAHRVVAARVRAIRSRP